MTHHRRPNILFLMTDQHRVDTIGAYGNRHGTTPRLDALAARGTVFDAAYTPTAICTPARASLLTGRHPFEHGLLSNYEWNSGHREELPDGVQTLADALSAEGYRLGHVGKWHVGRHRGPSEHGFEGIHIPGALNNYQQPEYQEWLASKGFPQPTVREAIRTTLPDGSEGHLLAGIVDQPAEATFEAFLTDLALEKLDEFAATADAGTPFYLACNFFGPHLPYLLPEEWYRRYSPDEVHLPRSMAESFAGKPEVQRTYSDYWGASRLDEEQWRVLTAAYWGYVSMIDHFIGVILDRLEERGLTQDTAVFFTADHGEFTGAHRLNDKGPAMYEDIYRIPGMVVAPGARPEQRSSEFITLLDFTSSILDLTGATLPDVRGTSLMGLVAGDEDELGRDCVVCEFHGHHFPYAQRMIRTAGHKLVVNPEGRDELYDLTADPDELLNVVDVPAYAAIARELRLRLYSELVARGDRFAQWMAMMQDIPVEQRIRPETAVESALG
ncbi:MAG: sulfatase-like hydrolase/transferase [Microbacterium sp.]